MIQSLPVDIIPQDLWREKKNENSFYSYIQVQYIPALPKQVNQQNFFISTKIHLLSIHCLPLIQFRVKAESWSVCQLSWGKRTGTPRAGCQSFAWLTESQRTIRTDHQFRITN